MARTPVKKKREVNQMLLMSTEQASALLNHLTSVRRELNDSDRRKFDDGPLGKIRRSLGGSYTDK